MSGQDAFEPVTHDEPCVICGKGDWCRRTMDGAHECHRIGEPLVNGLVRIATTLADYSIYRRPENRHSLGGHTKTTKTKPRCMFSSPENAAERFASWKKGTVECIYRWSEDWCRARIQVENGKTFCEITRSGSGWILKGPAKPCPLYRINEVPTSGTVFVCEGEKACDAGWSIGLPCVTSGAADSARFADWTPLSGRDAVILPDHDEPGMRYADKVARQLQLQNQAASVKIVKLACLRKSEDLYDFVNEHRDSREADDIQAEIMSIVAATPTCELMQESTANGIDWPEPKPLPDEVPPVLPFDYDLLPESLRPWIRDVAERIQCPPDFPAIAAMIAIATVVGRKIGLRPKRRDDWLVVPNLWGIAIGPPSVMKTPAIQEPLKALKRLEIEAKKQFDEKTREFAAQQLVAEQRMQVAKTAIRKSLAKGSGDALAEAQKALQNDTPSPIRKRYFVNDSTVEKLGEILNENPNGVLVFRDELVGFLKSLDKEGQEGARSFYLESWNGDSRYTYDRIGRGTIDIEAAIVSIIGSIQPGPLRAYLHAAVSNDKGADGLMQRFQLAVYPDTTSTWQNVDRWPNVEARNRAFDVINSLSKLDPSAIGARIDEGNTIPYLRFELDAQNRFYEWRAGLEHRLRSDGEHPVVVAHLAKYRSLIPSLALLCHLAETHNGPVDIESLDRAIAWDRYLESHARRIYSVAVAPDTAEAHALARKIRRRDLPDEFSLREIYHNGWIGLGTRSAAARAVELLVDLDWLTEVVESTAGRSRTRYVVNPRVERKPPNGTVKTVKSQET